MKRAADFKSDARVALNGRWAEAVGTTFVATLLGADILMAGSGSYVNFGNNKETYQKMSEEIPTEVLKYIIAFMIAVGSIIAIFNIIRFIVGSFVSLGLIDYNMKLIDEENASFSDLFSRTALLGKALWLRIRIIIFTFLWTLLLIIPGIIKSYAYSMSGFIMAENPEIDAKEAMRISTEMMKGNKWRLFCLNISFIGWAILSILTLGIGYLFLNPYMNASAASFYDEISRDYSG